MSNIKNKPTRIPKKFIFALISFLTLIIVAEMIFSSYITDQIVLKYTPMVDASVEIKTEVTTAHLWLEEILSSGWTEKMASVWAHLNNAEWYIEAMLEGGEISHGTFERVEEPEIRILLNKVLNAILKIRDLTDERLKLADSAAAGSEMDMVYNAAFKQFNFDARNLEVAFKKVIKNKFENFNTINNALIYSAIIIGLFIGFILFNYEIKKWEDYKSIKTSEKLLKESFTQAAIGMITVSLNGHFINVNNIFSTMIGYSERELLQMKFNDVTHPDDKQIGKKLLDQMIDDKIDSGMIEKRYLHKNGKIIYVRITTTLLRDEKEEPLHFFAQVEDITERKQTEEELKNSEQRFKIIFNNSGVGISQLSMDGKFEIVNPRFADIIGYSVEELLTKSNKELTHPEDNEETYKNMILLKERKINSFSLEKRLFHKNGDIIWIMLDVTPRLNLNDEIIGVIGVATDITERKQTEEELIKSKSMLSDVLNTIPVRVFWKDLDGNYLGCNQLFALDAGKRNPDEVIGDNDYNMGWADQAELYRSDDKYVIESGRAKINYEEHQTKPDGDMIWLNTSKIPLRDSNGVVYGVLGTYEDVTDLKQTELKLQEMNTIINSSPAVAFLWKASGNWPIEFVSENVTDLTGYSSNELISGEIKYSDIIHPEDFERVVKEVEVHSKNKEVNNFKHSPYRIITKNGEVKWVDDVTVIRRNAVGNATYFEGIVIDITDRKKANEALKESQQLLSLHIEKTPLAVIEWDLDFKVSDWNPAAEKIFGYSKDEAIGRHAAGLIVPESVREHVDQVWNELLKNEGGTRSSNDNNTKDGKIIYCEWYNTPLITEAGEVVGVASLVQDVTEIKEAENALIENEEKFRSIVTNTEEIIFMIDSKGIFTLSEGKGLAALGLTPGQVVGVSVNEIYKDYPDIIEGINEALSGETVYDIVKVGENFFNIWFTPHMNADGKIVGCIGMAINITNEKEAEQKLIEQKEYTQTVLANLHEDIFIIDKDYKITDVNQSVMLTSGYTRDEIIGKHCYEISHNSDKPCDLTGEECHLKQVFKDGLPANCRHVHLNKEGEKEHTDILLSPLKDSDGNITHVIEAMRDVSDIYKAEEQIRKLSQAVEQSSSSVVITDINGNIEYVNPKFEEVTGYSFNEAVGENPRVLKSEKINDEDYKILWDTISSGKSWTGELLNKKKNGKLFWELASISPVKDDNNKITHYLAIKEDITERKEIEQKLTESEMKYRRFFEDDLTADYISTNDGQILDCNISLLNMFGFDSLEQAQKTHIGIFYPNKEERDKFLELLTKNKKLENYELKLKKVDGTIIDVVENVIGEFDDNDELIRIRGYMLDVSEKKKAEEEVLKYQAHLEDLVYQRTENLTKVNKKLETEITKRKSAETKAREAYNKEKELNELKTRFISTASHEFKTPLTAVLSSAELLDRYGRKWDESKYKEHLMRIINSVDYLNDLINDVLTISRTETGKIKFEPKQLNIITTCNNIFEEVQILLSEKHQLEKNCPIEDPIIYLDEKLLKFILINLLSNAIKYSPEGGKIRWDIRVKDRKLNIKISDEGIGIPKDNLKNLFSPFYRTDNVKDIPGTGLGLSIVKRSVDLHNGIIKVNSKEGEGTEFHVIIPFAEVNES